MVLNKVYGNIKEFDSLLEFHVERIYLSNDQLLKKLQKIKSNHEIHHVLDFKNHNGKLRDGDIVFKENNKIIVIFALSTDVLIVKPKSIHEMGVIAHKIGNRHTPAQFIENELYVQYDYLLEKLAKDLNIEYERTEKVMNKSFDYEKIEGGHSHS